LPDIERASRSEIWIKAWLLVLAKTLRGKSLADVDSELCRSWTIAFRDRNITQAEGEAAFRKAQSRLVFFPTPAEVIAFVDSKQSPLVIPSPIGYVFRKGYALPIWHAEDLAEGETMFATELELFKSRRQPTGEAPSMDDIADKKRMA